MPPYVPHYDVSYCGIGRVFKARRAVRVGQRVEQCISDKIAGASTLCLSCTIPVGGSLGTSWRYKRNEDPGVNLSKLYLNLYENFRSK